MEQSIKLVLGLFYTAALVFTSIILGLAVFDKEY
jgi:hypothetical protein